MNATLLGAAEGSYTFASRQIRSFTSPAMKRFALKQKKAAAAASKLSGAQPQSLGAFATSATSPAGVQSPITETEKFPTSCKEMENSALLTLAALNVTEARIEVLKRHIMCVDKASYEEAEETFEKIAVVNHEGLFLNTIPYKLGIGTSLFVAFASFPLCFHEPTVHLFNEYCVTADIPEAKDLETALEVGSWAWNWMEPPLGQISFFLLCLQYARSQLQNIGIRPYTSYIKSRRAKKLSGRFPTYEKKIIENYSRSVDYY